MKKPYFLTLALFIGLLFFYQNCNEVTLIGGLIAKNELLPPEVTPDTIPETPTTLPTDPGKPTEYNQETEATDNCGGSYFFEQRLEYKADGSFDRVIFQLKDRVTGQYIRPDRWESTTQGIPITDPPEYSLDAGGIMRGCDLVSVQAHFKNRCGEDVSLGYIFTAPGCPPPNPSLDVACEDIVKPDDHERLLQAAKRHGNTGPFPIGPVDTLVRATTRNPTPELIAADFLGSSASWIKIPNGKYLSMSFTAPAAGSTFETWVSGSGGCAVTMSVSKCEGDFYLGRNAKNCLSPSHGEVAFLSASGIPDSHPASRFACRLEPGEKYFVNIIGYNFISGQSVNAQECIWFGGLNNR